MLCWELIALPGQKISKCRFSKGIEYIPFLSIAVYSTHQGEMVWIVSEGEKQRGILPQEDSIADIVLDFAWSRLAYYYGIWKKL